MHLYVSVLSGVTFQETSSVILRKLLNIFSSEHLLAKGVMWYVIAGE